MQRTELLQMETAGKEPRRRSLTAWLTYHQCMERESSVEQLAMFGVGSRLPACLHSQAQVRSPSGL